MKITLDTETNPYFKTFVENIGLAEKLIHRVYHDELKKLDSESPVAPSYEFQTVQILSQAYKAIEQELEREKSEAR